MRTAECTIVVDRPPEALFDFLLNADHAPEWRDHVSRMEWLDPPGTGARARLCFWAEGKERTQDVTLVEYDRPRRYTFVNHNEGFRFTSANAIEPHGTGAKLTLTADVEGDSIWGRLLLPMVRRRHRARFQKTLERLKAAAEKPR